MNLTDCTPTTVAPVFVQLDQVEALRVAQRAGDLAYTLAQRAGALPEALADIYHAVFTDTMSDLGQPMPCSCYRCQALQKGGH